MSKASSWLGVAIFVVVFAHQASRHGQTWEFSPCGIPVSLLSSDVQRYRNGEAIDPISHAIIRGGMEERVKGCLIAALLGGALWWGYEVLRCKRALDARARRIARGGVLQRAKAYEREGKTERAKAAFEYYWRLLDEEIEIWRRNPSTRRELDNAMERRAINQRR
jgi:hypothetical protein